MKVDRDKAISKQIASETYYFCSNHCLHAFEPDSERYMRGSGPADHAQAADAHH